MVHNEQSLQYGENTSSSYLTPAYCGSFHEVSEQAIFWIEGVLLCAVGIIGLFGNMVTFRVLSKIPSKYNIFNKLLMQLVSVDSISILLIVVDYSLRKSFHLFSLDDMAYATIWPNIIYPFIKISYTWIMCCTIAITIER